MQSTDDRRMDFKIKVVVPIEIKSYWYARYVVIVTRIMYYARSEEIGRSWVGCPIHARATYTSKITHALSVRTATTTTAWCYCCTPTACWHSSATISWPLRDPARHNDLKSDKRGLKSTYQGKRAQPTVHLPSIVLRAWHPSLHGALPTRLLPSRTSFFLWPMS